MTTTPTPQSIDVLLESRVLELGYADGTVLAQLPMVDAALQQAFAAYYEK